MSDKQPNFEIARNLGPGDAPETCAALLGWLGERAGGGHVDIAPGVAAPSPLAVQLLVAADRSRTFGPVRFGPEAERLLAALGTAAPLPSAGTPG